MLNNLSIPHAAQAATPQSEVTIRVNGKTVDMKESPAYVDSKLHLTYVPLRFVSEALGAKVNWQNMKSPIKVTLTEPIRQEITVWLDRKQAILNDATVELAGGPTLNNGRLMVPLRVISEGLGAKVSWSSIGGGRGIVDITAPWTEPGFDRMTYKLQAMPVHVAGVRGDYYGDENVTIEQLQHYDAYLDQTVMPRIAAWFPQVNQVEAKPPSIIVLSTADSLRTWTSKLWLAYYPEHYATFYFESNVILLTSQFDRSTETMLTLAAHEYTHWLIRHAFGSTSKLPVWLDEGIAHHVAWAIREQRTDWNTAMAASSWEDIAQSNTEVPELWTYTNQDSWIIAATQMLIQNYGYDKLARFLSLTASQSAVAAFKQAFGITPDQYQQLFNQEVARQRHLLVSFDQIPSPF